MSYSAANARRTLCFGAIAMFSISMISLAQGTITHAVSSSVNAAVCGAGAGATLTIDSPQSDSVVNQPTVQVNGTVTDATQIEVSIDGQYNSTVPLSSGQTNYQTSVQLTTGTHTIALVANDVCQMQDANASVVVTYQSPANPGTGQQTPTDVNQGGGIEVGGQPIDQGDSSAPIGAENWPIIGPIIRLGYDAAENLDFEVGTPSGTLWRSTLRFSFIVTGISIAVLGNAAAAAWGLFGGTIPTGWRWGIRLGGVALIIAAFFI
jgi:hypothetical protein